MDQYSNNTERYIQTLRSMADEMDMNLDLGMDQEFQRGNYFIRATEIHPFLLEKKRLVVELCKNLIEQQQIIKESGGSVNEQVVIIEKMYYVFTEYPELISQNPRFRKVVYEKIDEHSEACMRKNIEVPQILKDMPFILKMLEARSDYIREVPSLPLPLPLAINASPLPTLSTRQDVCDSPSHNYNLRSKRQRTY